MHGFIQNAINRSRTVLLMLVLILTIGSYSYSTISKESFPDINIPYVTVSMHHEGISPEDAERILLRNMEKELKTIEGVKEITSKAYQGGASITLEFIAGFDADEAKDEVQTVVDENKSDLPEETDEPIVQERTFEDFPVIVATLSGSVPERILTKKARILRDEIEKNPSVLEVNITGDREEIVEVILDPERLENYNLDTAEVLQIIANSNQLVAAGNLDTGSGSFAIKVPGLFETIKDILLMPIKTNGDAVVRVMDIAKVRRHFKDPQSFARMNGNNAIALEITKRSGENLIETVESAKKAIEKIQNSKDWPKAIKITYTSDQSIGIRDMLTELQNNVLSAIILVMIVCVAALGWRSGLLVGISVPGSFLAGIMIIHLSGLTVNMVVLFGLILSVGILVDGAIVVTEYADRKMSEGIDKKVAYAEASKRMAWPIISSTATTLAAFFPLLFWPGMTGEFMKYLPITVLAVLISSLFMALIFVPTLGGIWGAPGATSEEEHEALVLAENGDLNKIKGFTGKYIKFLEKALSHYKRVLWMAVGSLFLAVFLYGAFGKGVEFFPSSEPDEAQVIVHARGNMSIYEKDRLVREVEEIVLQEHGMDSVYTSVIHSNGGSQNAEDIIGTISLDLMDWDTRDTADEILARIKSKADKLGGIVIETKKNEGGPGGDKPIELEISGTSFNDLASAIKTIEKAMEDLGGFRNIETTAPLPGIQWEVDVDRAQAAKFGLSLSSVGSNVRLITNGMKIGSYRPDDSDDEVDIYLRYPRNNRTIFQIKDLRIKTPNGWVPISNFIELEPKQKTSTINKTDTVIVMSLKSDITLGSLANDKMLEISNWITENPDKLPKGIKIKERGENEDQAEAAEFLKKAFSIALFIMLIILVTQFNCFFSAGLILSAVVLSTIGVLVGLIITGSPFGIVMSGIGVIALAGIVVNNNIVLVDTFSGLENRYSDGKEVILRTCAQRLRPVLLTTITTALGLLPMATTFTVDFIAREVSYGAPSTSMWQSLAITIVFGLMFATALTLVVTPCALMLKVKMDKGKKKDITEDKTPLA
ncbi:MAG: efflux RND transporter permease subunit [Alphaproteobacteria bacterium]|jgi:multidrug efflux pump|nr:efflux RND transporter permease subunit [Alphaproteobacteria bacterium]